jgi:hypothetical protein
MPLNYDFSKCKDKKFQDTTEHERYTFSSLMMSCNMSKLTKENFLEFLDRLAIHQLFIGYELVKLNKTNKKWFKRFIGASFNVSQMTMRQWFSMKFKNREKYDYTK